MVVKPFLPELSLQMESATIQSMSGNGKANPKASFPGQHEGEELQMVFHQHPLVMRKALIYGLVAIVLCILPLDFVFDGALYPWLVKLAIIVPLLVFAAWFYRWVGWYYTVYIVTNLRIIEIHQRGFFNRRVNEYQLNKVLNINYHIRGFQAVLFSYGEISVEMITNQTLIMRTIHKPVRIHARLMDVVQTYAGQPRHFSEESVA